jgi:hypothetical protein
MIDCIGFNQNLNRKILAKALHRYLLNPLLKTNGYSKKHKIEDSIK